MATITLLFSSDPDIDGWTDGWMDGWKDGWIR